MQIHPRCSHPFSGSADPWASTYPTGQRTKLDLARGEAAGLLDAYCVQGSERVNPEPASGQFRANVVLIGSGATGSSRIEFGSTAGKRRSTGCMG